MIDGQKVWTSNAHFSDWLFVIARTEPGSERHHGLSFLLVPIDQDGVDVRPIEQLTGGSEFNEVFLTGARTAADLVVGEPGQGWGVAMGLLGFERGVSILAQLVDFDRELDGLVDAGQGQRRHRRPDPARPARRPARRARGDAVHGAAQPLGRQGRRGLVGRRGSGLDLQARLGRLAQAARRGRHGRARPGRSARRRGAPYDLDEWQRLFLFSRADTIYGGSDEVQRNILAERVLGLPREPKGTASDDQ